MNDLLKLDHSDKGFFKSFPIIKKNGIDRRFRKVYQINLLEDKYYFVSCNGKSLIQINEIIEEHKKKYREEENVLIGADNCIYPDVNFPPCKNIIEDLEENKAEKFKYNLQDIMKRCKEISKLEKKYRYGLAKKNNKKMKDYKKETMVYFNNNGILCMNIKNKSKKINLDLFLNTLQTVFNIIGNQKNIYHYIKKFDNDDADHLFLYNDNFVLVIVQRKDKDSFIKNDNDFHCIIEE